MPKSRTHEEFIEELLIKNEHYKNGEFQVIGEHKGGKKRILLRDVYSDHIKTTYNLLLGEKLSTATSTNNMNNNINNNNNNNNNINNIYQMFQRFQSFQLDK